MVTTAEKRVWTKEDILDRLANNDFMVGKSLVKLYEKQTLGEQASHSTHEKNFKGFNGVDAGILSSFAEFYKKYDRLSPKQLVLARKKLAKYAGQLTIIANS